MNTICEGMRPLHSEDDGVHHSYVGVDAHGERVFAYSHREHKVDDDSPKKQALPVVPGGDGTAVQYL